MSNSKNDPSMTPSNVLPGELFDIEEAERELRAAEDLEMDLACMSDQEYDAWVASHEIDAEADAKEKEICDKLLNDPNGPQPGTWAFTARLMALTSDPDDDFDWDAWKDQMKEAC